MPLAFDIFEDGRTTVLLVGGRKIRLERGDLLDLAVDALVCPVDPKLDLTSGLARQISKAAGPNLKNEKPVVPEPYGKVIVMPGGNLNVKYVFLSVILGEKNLDKMKRSIQQAVDRAIRYAEFLKLKSLAFPLLGSAEAAPPYRMVAREMIEQAALYFQRRHTKVKTVFFSAFNNEAYSAFCKEAKSIADL